MGCNTFTPESLVELEGKSDTDWNLDVTFVDEPCFLRLKKGKRTSYFCLFAIKFTYCNILTTLTSTCIQLNYSRDILTKMANKEIKTKNRMHQRHTSMKIRTE